MGTLETHFKLIDFSKNLLFNSTHENQEQQARHLLDLAKEQENYLEV